MPLTVNVVKRLYSILTIGPPRHTRYGGPNNNWQTMNLDNAYVYDIETFPNAFTLAVEALNNDKKFVWEISDRRDDRQGLFDFLNWCNRNGAPMIGFNNIGFDYIVLHQLWNQPQATYADLYQKAMAVINSYDKFGFMIWESDRFAPQIDLFRINHFDNKAKTTSLKALQINMRSHSVVDMPVALGAHLSAYEIDAKLIPYNQHDVSETKAFAWHCMDAIKMRIGLLDQIKGDVLNFNDTKIGEKLLEQRIGDAICYEPAGRDNNGNYIRKKPRQTFRNRIPLADVICPYVYFENPEFNRVLNWMKAQTLSPEDLENPDAPAQTKGVFKDVIANVGGVDFYFGTGGIHASVKPQRIVATDEYPIRDIDVSGFYPSFAIVNKLAPEHLGEAYTREYGRLPIERKEWQKKKGKKCVEANSLKLAGNGVYGKSNSPFSVFYDPKYTMAVTINCQLVLCMLAEWLLRVPTLQIIQANTDGITYRIHRDHEPQAAATCRQWEQYTCLTLEDVNYTRMFIRDVNNYIAESKDGTMKLKGAYWTPDPLNYAKSISESQPPAWHKDLGNCVSIRAAVGFMLHGIDPDIFVRTHTDKFDFMLRAKVNRDSKLMLGETEIQGTSRYYVSTDGQPLRKVSPSTGIPGQFKRANKIPEQLWISVMNEIGPNVWDARIHAKNKKVYEDNRVTAFEAGWKVTECNNVDSFRFDNINFKYYADEARKLVI